MANKTKLVGKQGGGLTWTKVSGSPKTVAWNAPAADQFMNSVQLGTDKRYLLAMKYTYTSGNPANCSFQIQELRSGGTSYTWSITGPYAIATGTHEYPVMVSKPFEDTGTVAIKFNPGYNSGTHVLSAGLYYTEAPTL
jgi:hypothetical protein